MLDRKQIKQRARKAQSCHYGIGIGLYILPTLCFFGVFYALMLAVISPMFPILTIASQGSGAVAMLKPGDFMTFPISIVIGEALLIPVMLVYLAMYVGTEAGYIRLYRDLPVSVAEPFRVFGRGFWRKLGGMAKVVLFTWLWGMLGVVPFIATMVMPSLVPVSSYVYTTTNLVAIVVYLFGFWLLIYKVLGFALTGYILAEYPEVPGSSAIRLSNRMMKGHRGELIVASLSFFWWYILGAISFHIVTLIYVVPYMNITYAGFYTKFRDMALLGGVISPEELGDSLMAVPASEPEPEPE